LRVNFFRKLRFILDLISGADHIGGPDYIKALKEPLPQVELLPTKGVDFKTAPMFIKAGAIAVGTGSALVSKALMANKDYVTIAENAVQFIRIIRDARGEM
jgi:2-dehydro-3-deoxyphosphogluconate aldolase/(4S)-4-hydroxy-2-oxoglutarate aldolase